MILKLQPTPPAFTLLEGGGVESAWLVLILGFVSLKFRRFVRRSGQPRTDAWLWIYAEIRLSGPNSVNAFVACRFSVSLVRILCRQLWCQNNRQCRYATNNLDDKFYMQTECFLTILLKVVFVLSWEVLHISIRRSCLL